MSATVFNEEILAKGGLLVGPEELPVTTGEYAPLHSPTFTGIPAGPTAAGGTNTTQLATTAFVHAAAAETVALAEAAAEAVANVVAASKLAKAENLKDLPDAATARTNLGLGTAAVEPASAFDAKGAATTAAAAAQAAAEAAALAHMPVHATVTGAGTLTAGQYTPCNAEAGSFTMKLPTGEALGTLIAVEKTDSSTHVVTLEGNLRGSEGTITLKLEHETLLLEADAAGHWWPLASHKTLGSLDARYQPELKHELGEIEGEVTPNLSQGSVFLATLKGNTTIEKPTNWRAAGEEIQSALLVVKQPVAGGMTLTFGAGITAVGGAPNEEPNATSAFWIWSPDGGTTVYAFNAVEGQQGIKGTTGATGATGATGPEGRQGPPGATGETKNLGEIGAGTHQLNLSEALAFTMVITGNVVLELINWPAGLCEPEIEIIQNAAGGHTIEIVSEKSVAITWVPEEEAPAFKTNANEANIVPLASYNKGVTVYGVRGLRGKTGATGATGATGPEGKTGAEGAAGLQSRTKLILPYGTGFGITGKAASTAVGTKYLAYYCMMICEQAGELLGLYYYNGATAAGELRVALFDTGQTTAGKYTRLAESGSIKQEGTSKWKLATFASAATVTAGQAVMAGIMSNETTSTFAMSETTSEGATGLPEGAIFGFGHTNEGTGMGSFIPVFGLGEAFAELKFASEINKEHIKEALKGVFLYGQHK